MNDSLEYYNLHAKEFFDNTRDVEFTEMQDRFLKYLNPGARILDFGCGSGSETKYFLGRGFKAEAVDGSEELVKIAAEYTGANVRQMFFQDLNENETYDGIWACSSILHLTYSELAEVVVKKMCIRDSCVSICFLLPCFCFWPSWAMRPSGQPSCPWSFCWGCYGGFAQ